MSATYLGKAYLAFTTEVGGVEQVRSAYYSQGSWALEPTPLNAVATESAGTGTDAPSVAAAQDGVGIVAWGEAGHVYLRRVWGASPSVDVYQADLPSVGFDSEVSATDPRIAAGADSSFVEVAFDETVSNGAQQQTRVLLHELDASVWSSLAGPDGLATPGLESAGDPQVAMGEYGDGVATAVRGTSNQVWGMNLLNNGAPTSAIELDSLPNASPPDAISAASGFYSGLAAWQHDPGPSGTAEIRTRFYTNHAWGPEIVLSDPAGGATDADAGLAAAGDLNADMAVAWVQGSGPGTQIVTDQLYQPPGGFSAVSSFRYVRSTYPLLAWNAPHELWGPRYELSVDGGPPVQTSQTSIRFGRLTQGPHTWSVEAINGAGLESSDKTATVFVDTYPPAVVPTLSGTLQVHDELHLYVTYSDTPPGAEAADGSGVVSVVVNWGDGSKYVITHGKYHQYANPGRYRRHGHGHRPGRQQDDQDRAAGDQAEAETETETQAQAAQAGGARVTARRFLGAVLAAVLGASVASALAAGSVTAQTQQTTTSTTTSTTTTTTTTTTAPPGPVYTATPPTNQVLYRDGQTGRYLLGGEWLFRSDPANVGIAQGWSQNNPSTLGWTPVTVPNADNAGNFSNASMDGTIGWYRRDFTLPANAFGRWVPNSDRDWIVRFESANYNATVWLNGRELGTHNVAYLPFEFNLGDLKAGVNRLIVRVDNIRTSADFPPGLGGIWWNSGGLLREVYLRSAARADLQRAIVRPILPCSSGQPPARHPASPDRAAPESSSCAATIDEQALVRNVTTQPQTVQLTGTYGNQRLFFGEHTIAPGGTWTATATALIAKPRLWSLDAPQLYKATMTLSDLQGRRLGGYVDYSGIRSITVVNGHLELNGRQLHIRGVNMHEQNVLTGAALSPAQLATLMGWMKELGATMIRAHYPLNPEIEEMADRDGILLWSEVPVYQINDKYFRQASWLRQALALVKTNIQTNQNHPSVAIWSIGNELPQTVDSGEANYISKAAALAHQLDPTRPVGLAIKDWPGLPCQAAQYAPLDVIGVNEYFGWFDVGGGVTDDRDALGPFLNTVHQCLPTKAIMMTEFGVDANRSGPVEERGTYAFQANTAAYDLGVFAARPWLSGALYFLIQDYPAYPGYNGGNPLPSPPFNNKGLVDLYGNLKPAFGVVQSIYENTVQIGHERDATKVRSDQRQGLWAGGSSPRCSNARRVAARPRGVRSISPRCSRYGS